ncbi:MAG: T9SS type A sorting domain-containing protein [Bacteroidetes bacterium]|nr:T9SS type A sorting domain-containing protein [Bacteroidota bacterium]
MKRNINPKETLAWIVLVCAAFLFGVTVVFAQANEKNRKNSTTIHIRKNLNGNVMRLDTTFRSGDSDGIMEVLHQYDLPEDFSLSMDIRDDSGLQNLMKKHVKIRTKGMTGADRQRLKEEMKNLDEKMKDINIEIFSDQDGKGEKGYSFQFDMPRIPELPDFDFNFPGDEITCRPGCHEFCFHELDSLEDEDHLVMMGDENENPPVFEKELTGKHGEKYFVFKRAKKMNEQPSSASGQVQLYPNPNNGTFSIRYQSASKEDLEVSMYDNQGKEVYSETLKNFNGEYFNQVDLPGKEKGNYILKISQGEKVVTEKFVIE